MLAQLAVSCRETMGWHNMKHFHNKYRPNPRQAKNGAARTLNHLLSSATPKPFQQSPRNDRRGGYIAARAELKARVAETT